MAQQGDETILEEAKNLLVQGKRFMALEDYQSATDSLEQACQLFDAFYGVAKRPCADAYLEYGLALVALANLEAGTGTDRIMKKAGIEGDEEGEEDGEDEEGEDEEGEDEEQAEEGSSDEKKEETDDVHMKEASNEQDAISTTITNNNCKTTESDEKTTNGVIDKNTESDDKTISKPCETASSSNNINTDTNNFQVDPTPGTSSGATTSAQTTNGEEEDVDNEEATTIEIAWEVLCLAKRLFMEDESLEGRLKLAETLQKIGEISIEWDNNDNAVSILEECLKVRKAILHPDDRLIALTYYNLGLAHSFKSDTQQANENFQNAINVIEHRIKTLTEDLEKAKSNQDTVAIGSYQKEINELKELLPDMTMRLDDSKEEDDSQNTEVLKRTREEMQLEDEEAKKVCLNKSKPVDDISHLVKRKAT